MEDVARLVSTCILLDHSYQGPKDPEEVVRAALERDGLPYRTPEPSASLSIRTLFASPRNGRTRAYTASPRIAGHSTGESDPESFGSTPRARLRERLHPHLPLLGTHGVYDGDGGHPLNRHRTLESPTGRTSPNPTQPVQEALLFSNAYSTSPLSLTDTPPLSRSSERESRQSSLERTTAAVFSQPTPARYTPLAQPSPLSLSSVPLPEMSPEDSPEVLQPNDTNSAPLPAGRTEVEGHTPVSENKEPSLESSLYPQPLQVPAASPDCPESLSETPPDPTSDLTSQVEQTYLSDASAAGVISELSNEEQQRALEVLRHENARLQDLNLVIMWMREETKRHVERLHHDRIVIHGEEMERQNLVSLPCVRRAYLNLDLTWPA